MTSKSTGKKDVVPLNVSNSIDIYFYIKSSDPVVWVGFGNDKVDETTQECPPRSDHTACEIAGSHQRLNVAKGSLFTLCYRSEFCSNG